jgi:hypothetical protein
MSPRAGRTRAARRCRVLHRLPGAPGRRGRPCRVSSCACPAGRGRATGRGNRAGNAGPRRPWPPSCSGWMCSGCCSPSSSGAPEFNQFVIELAPVGGFRPNLVPGDRGQRILASVDPVVQGRCVLCAVLVRADRRRDGVAGRWWLQRHGIRGRCCAGPVIPPSTSAPSSTPRVLPRGSADWNPAPARD